MPTPSFTDFRDGLLNGDGEAARYLFERYAVRLVALARAQLDTWVRHKVDVEEVVQSVFKSFFLRCRSGEFELADPASLWRLLARITVNKCVNQVEYFQAARRDARREEPLSPPDSVASARDLIDHDPTPEQAAIITETLAAVMRDLSDREREILVLHLQGHEVESIAETASCSLRSVRRCLQIARQQLLRELSEEGSSS